jgi:hypothetical protein
MSARKMRCSRNLLAVLVAAGSLACASAANANLLLNGSFEQPPVPASSLTCGSSFNTACQGYFSPDEPCFAGGDDIAGWSVIGLGGICTPEGKPTAVIMQLGNGYTEPDFGNGQTLHFFAQNGTQSLDLTGEGNEGYNGVKQSITSNIGDEYRISFYIGHQYSQAPGYGNGTLIPTSVDLWIDGQFVETLLNSNDTPENVNWKKFFYDFTATDILTTFAFISSTALGNNYAGLDNVVVNDLSTVPEPGSLPILAAGLAAFLFVGRVMARRAR